ATEVPACNEVQCGWAASHSLEGAKELAKKSWIRNKNGHMFLENSM
ncbi:S-ribosylhomocysteinase, partial [Listeria cornellensis FSL F6-0969]